MSDTTIKKLIKENELLITPFPKDKDIRPSGIRVHLGDTLLSYSDGQTVDPTKSQQLSYEEIHLKEKPFILQPGKFVLGSTCEAFKTPRNLSGFLDGRSTLARLGLTIHITATITDGLYEEARTITLEIHNASNLNIVLSHQMPIGSMLFFMLDQPVAQDVQQQYRHQNGVTPANLTNQYQ